MSETVRKEFNESEISDLRLEIGAAELIIMENENKANITVILEDGEADIFSAENKGERLEIFYNKKNVKISKDDKLEKIIVMIPEEKMFKIISLTSGAGDTKIQYPGLQSEDMKIGIGAGKLKAEKMTISKNMQVEVGAGKAKFENVRTGNLMIEVGVGKCSYKGTVEQNMKAECGVGKVDVVLEGKESDYNYKVSCGLGKVKVNGKSSGVIASSKTMSPQAKGTMELECGIGKIDIVIE